MPKLQLRTILLVLALVAFLSASTGGYLYYSALKESAFKEAERPAAFYANAIKDRVSSHLLENLKSAKALAEVKQLHRALVDRDESTLVEANAILNYFHDALGFGVCSLMDLNGATVASSNPEVFANFIGKNYESSPYFRDAIKGKPALCIAPGSNSERRSLYHSHPVYGEVKDTPIGVIVIEASLQTLEKEFSQISKGIVLLKDPQDVIRLSNRKDWLDHVLWESSRAEISQVAETQQSTGKSVNWTGLKMKTEKYALDKSGTEYLIYQMKMGDYLDWSIIYLASLDEISKKVLDPLIRTSGSVILILCALIGVSVFFLYRIASHDIVQRKMTEAALRESEERYRTVLEANPDPVVVYDMEGKIIYLNPAFTRVFGWTLTELFGKKMDVFVPKENWPETKMMTRKVLAGKSSSGIETSQYTKKGNIVPVSISGAAYVDREGNPIGIIVNLRDISERKKLEAQLFQSQKMEAIGTLAGGVAHDFNNLLQSVQGYAELLLLDKGHKNPDHRKLQNIRHAAKRGAELTRQLLTFGRKVESKRRPVDLNHEVGEVRKLLDRTIPKMIEIKLQLAEHLNIVNADPVQIEQILVNLALNARDAMSDGSKIIIETENTSIDEEFCKTHAGARPGEYALLSISDTGHGMDRDTLEHIFEPFYSTKEVGKGTGLGLAMVYGIVKSHEGYITCNSEPGVGTMFKIYLPAIDQEVEIVDIKEIEAPIKGGNETILLVDDEEFIRELGMELLGGSGYNVLTAADGESALQLYRKEQNRIELILLDLIMPGMGGRKCLEELLRVNPRARVLIASGYSADGPTKEALGVGARDYISKPYDAKQMLKVVREVLEQD